MGKNRKEEEHGYHHNLRRLQMQLVCLQRHLIAKAVPVLVIVEGRDAAGKDGAIKRLTAHMSPRDTRVYAPGKPSDREETQWYFQRFVPHLPAGGEFVIFNRSWYNRAGVERVMKFASKSQVEDFLAAAPAFERMLASGGLELRKYYLDISRKEQKERLAERRDDPLKSWKISPIDAAAPRKWSDYSRARDAMLRHTSHEDAPWRVVRSNDKKTARLELLRSLLDSFSFPGKKPGLCRADPAIVGPWRAGMKLAP